ANQEKAEELQVSSKHRQELHTAHDLERDYKNKLEEKKQYIKEIDILKNKEMAPLDLEKEALDKKSQEIDGELKEINQENQGLEKQIKAIEHQNIAVILAKDLSHGKDCPVCGS